MPTAEDISHAIIELDGLWNRFVSVRAAFPKARESDLGKHDIESKSWYRHQGKHLRLSFQEPIDVSTVTTINTSGYWVNQSFVIWLGSILKERLKVSSTPDTTLPGAEHVDLAIRLRNRLVHDIGVYRPDLESAHEAFHDLLRMYDPTDPDADRYNLHIDEVLESMFKGVMKYVKALEERVC